MVATLEILDLPNFGMTNTGTPTDTDDQHGLLKAYTYDGVTERSTKAITPFTVSSATQHTWQCWIMTTDTGVVCPMAQYRDDTTTQGGFEFFMSGGKILAYWFSGDSLPNDDYTWSRTSGTYTDGEWHLVSSTIIDGTVVIYVDGVPVALDNNSVDVGTGFTQFKQVDQLSFGAQFDGVYDWAGTIGRAKFYNGEGLSSTGVSDEYWSECMTVFIPDPTDKWTNLNAAPFTNNGGIVPKNDQHTSLSTGQLNGTDQDYSSSETPISGSSGAVHTVIMWFKCDAGDPDTTRELICQDDEAASNDAVFNMRINDDNRLQSIWKSGTFVNRIQSSVAAGTLNWDDLNWHLIGIRINGNVTNDVFIDGVEAAYDIHNSQFASGFTGAPAIVDNLSIGSRSDSGPNNASGTPSRPAFWEGMFLSDCQMAKYSSEENAARRMEDEISRRRGLIINRGRARI